MKKLILTMVLFLPMLVIAQPKKRPQKDQIEAQKIAFITKELDLTPDESQKFWPVYNQFNKERQEIKKQQRAALKPGKNIDELSDAELQKIMEANLNYKQKELDLEKQYHAKFLTVLPTKKVAKLYKAEEKFKRILLEKISKNRQGPPPPSDDEE